MAKERSLNNLYPLRRRLEGGESGLTGSLVDKGQLVKAAGPGPVDHDRIDFLEKVVQLTDCHLIIDTNAEGCYAHRVSTRGLIATLARSDHSGAADLPEDKGGGYARDRLPQRNGLLPHRDGVQPSVLSVHRAGQPRPAKFSGEGVIAHRIIGKLPDHRHLCPQLRVLFDALAQGICLVSRQSAMRKGLKFFFRNGIVRHKRLLPADDARSVMPSTFVLYRSPVKGKGFKLRSMARRRGRAIAAFGSAMALFTPAMAQTLTPRLNGDARLRLEQVDDEAFREESLAVTLAARASIEAALSPTLWALVEAEGVAALGDDYADGTEVRAFQPVIPDRETLEVNRAQLLYKAAEGLDLTLGRQHIALDDERFVGRVGFRQNEQTYDAARLSWSPRPGWNADISYVWQVNSFLGSASAHGPLEGENTLVNMSVATRLGQATTFLYALDFAVDDGPATESLTTGVRLAGRADHDDVGIDWEAAAAEQTQDGQAGDAAYALVGFRGRVGAFSARYRYESLGSYDGTAAFQTPLGTNHKFQGMTDVFAVTPPDGVREWLVATSAALGQIGPARGVTLAISWSDFAAARDGRSYGQEWSASFNAKIGDIGFGIDFARYEEKGFGSDQRRLWLTAARQF